MVQLDDEVTRYLNALKLAHELHDRQRYGGHAYTRHLAHVENVLVRFGFTHPIYLSAAWLHDAAEDSEDAQDVFMAINQRVGLYVCLLVEAVTDGKGKNRAERHVESFRRMRSRSEAIPLKLADRIANIESCLADENADLLKMYQKEHAKFRAELFAVSFRHEGLITARDKWKLHSMWAYLDELLITQSEA